MFGSKIEVTVTSHKGTNKRKPDLSDRWTAVAVANGHRCTATAFTRKKAEALAVKGARRAARTTRTTKR